MKASKISIGNEVILDLSQDTVTEEDVASGKTFHKADGSSAVGTAVPEEGSGFYTTEENEAGGICYSFTAEESESSGGAEFNIAYGDTEPEDTSMLWVKTETPRKIILSSSFSYSADKRDASASKLSITLPKQLGYVASATVGTNIYLFGGFSNSGEVNTIYCFDTVTQTLSTLAETLPNACCGLTCAVVGTNVYLFGGRSTMSLFASNRVFYGDVIWVFDAAKQTIRIITDGVGNANVAGLCCATDGTYIYLFGGYNGSHLTWISIFNTQTEKYEASQTYLPATIIEGCCAIVGTKIYITSGQKNDLKANTAFYCYDTLTKTISTLSAVLPQDYYGRTAVSIGKNVYIFGGMNNSYYINTVYCYDTEKDEIYLSCSMPEQNAYQSAAQIGDDVYIFGGYTNMAKNSIIKYLSPRGDILLDFNSVMIVPKLNENIFPIINTDEAIMEMGVEEVLKGNEIGIAESVEALLYKNGAWTQI